MTEEQVVFIKQKMLAVLDNAQMEVLSETLTMCIDKISADDGRNYIDDFIAAKRIEGRSEKTLEYYKSVIEKTVESIGKTVKHIITDDLRKYLSDYQEKKGSSKVTIDNMRRILSSFFGWLEDEELIIKSPVRRIHKVKASKVIKETYTDEELEKMRDSCDEIRDVALIDFLASTGMRVGELVHVNFAFEVH